MMGAHVIRRPAVAGYYYPADALRLSEDVNNFVGVHSPMMRARAVIVPHGSFARSGRIAGATLARVQIPRCCILIGPSHTGTWLRWGVMSTGAYRTPLGEVPIDTRCAEALLTRCPFLETDQWRHQGEHAIEVLLPFLQRLGPSELSIVPIIMNAEDPTECEALALALAQVIRLQEAPVLLVASADLSHYVVEQQAREQDRGLLEALSALDTVRLIQIVEEQKISVCGLGTMLCVMEAARHLGAAHAQRIEYGTSADAGGDPHSVIGYGGVVIE